MVIPDNIQRLMAIFQRAVESGDHTEVDEIPLADMRQAKHLLVCDRDFPYYSLLLEKIEERKSEGYALDRPVSSRETNFARNKEVFLAHRFAEEALIGQLKAAIEVAGYLWREGKRHDLGSISEDILNKIRDCGFFVAVMTMNDELKRGGFTTSIWLIEEKGAALAFGHRPLIMVEPGVDRHYVGFLHSDDEMIYFDRSDFDASVRVAVGKIEATYRRYGGREVG